MMLGKVTKRLVFNSKFLAFRIHSVGMGWPCSKTKSAARKEDFSYFNALLIRSAKKPTELSAVTAITNDINKRKSFGGKNNFKSKYRHAFLIYDHND